jgi:hypothetical protein
MKLNKDYNSEKGISWLKKFSLRNRKVDSSGEELEQNWLTSLTFVNTM